MQTTSFFSSVSLFAFALSGGANAFAQLAETADIKPIEEIVVTGEKVFRSLQDTPTSVAVITNTDISQQNIISLEDLFDRTANITSSFGGRNYTIRGINSTNVSGIGRGDLATIYVDGSPLPRNATLVGPIDVWDLQQVEVFRGPQSTLQGRNTLAGAVIINTANPTYEWTGRVRAIANTGAEEQRLGVALGGPIVEDQIAFRLAAEVSETEGVIDNRTLGIKADSGDSTFFRAKLLIEPEAIPDLSVLLSYTRDERRFGAETAELNTNDAFNNRETFSNRDSFDETFVDIGVVTIDYDFNDALRLTSISAINSGKRRRARDGDFTAEDLEFNSFDSDAKTYTQELRLAVDSGSLTGAVGGYYSKLEIPDEISRNTIGLDFVEDLGLINALVGGFGLSHELANQVASFYSDPILIQSEARNPIDIETYALFGDFTYQLNDSIRLIGGFRYDSEKQSVITSSDVSIVSTLPDPAAFPAALAPIITGVNGFAQAQADNASTAPVTLRSPTFSAFLPKLGISWGIADERNISFIVQRGYRSGGVGVNQARAEAFEFDQEFIWNYELSWRSRWLDNRLTLNANAFYIDWADQQVNVQISDNIFDVETQNAGSSEVLGFEVESNYQVNANLTIYGSVGYADTRFNEFDVVVAGEVRDFSGNEFPNAPKWTLAGGVTWQNDDGFFINLNGNHTSAAFPRADQTQAERAINARFLANFKAGWENEHFGVFITGDNIFNDASIQSIFPFNPDFEDTQPNFATFGEPQTFGLQIEAKF
ncbi:TonB-dependent receptor [Kordiimonas aquimaris]|uniref:TonB-dependent receptor n=1 Tax=Kordiimonas aquimaris TaxID=707591 RepID=UPI0021D10E26|nr:TonB-dependent receptor [Kordiimonas aquimaris]